MEFCTKRGLQNQTGHSVYDWPLVALRDLTDSAAGIDTDTIKSILETASTTSRRHSAGKTYDGR
jgi:hypothetical protein